MSGRDDRGLRLCLAGASDDTGNLGVSALMESALAGVGARDPRAAVTVFDNGRGVRTGDLDSGRAALRFARCGLHISRRYHRPESLVHIALAARLGGFRNPAARAIREADAVLDVSGGDSFSDIYGPRRFRLVTGPKKIALGVGTPLVLLPQTYGPFREQGPREEAERIVRTAAMAWARDEDSFEALSALAGDDFDPQRHRQGVDMAFALDALDPAEKLSPDLRQFLSRDDLPLVGLNVSGLLYNDPGAGRRYGFLADYRAVVNRLVRTLVRSEGARILLLPHVVGSHHEESDVRACAEIARGLAAEGVGDDRIQVAPSTLRAGEAKALIAQCDWFCGTRMHSTIAALSSGVPAAAIAYSMKTRGVFATCGQGKHVADARDQDTDGVLATLVASWRESDTARLDLAERIPSVLNRAEEQMAAIVDAVRQSSNLPPALTGTTDR